MERKEYISPSITTVHLNVSLLQTVSPEIDANVVLENGGRGDGTGESAPHGYHSDFEEADY